jgi:AcrR family transcriptional regulator
MSTHKKRIYNSKHRQSQTAITRGRILNCARSLFQSHGFEGVTIEQLAQAADVSMPTIYALFQSKRGVLRALMDEALPPEEFESLVRKFSQETSAKERFAITAQIARQLYDAECAQMDIIRGATFISTEFKALEHEREQRRYKRQEKSIKNMIDENALASHLSPEQARDILWAFTGRDIYRLFVIERGWTSHEYEKWLTQWLEMALLKR